MPNIAELSIDFSAKGTKTAIDNIMNMANAVNSLASNLKGIEGNGLKGLADGLKQIKSSIPTKNQTENMTNFATAVQQFATTLGNVNITQFSNDMANMSSAVQGMGARSVKSLTNAAKAMSNLQQQAKSTASSIPKMPSQPKFTPNTGSLTLANDFKDANSELQKSVYMANTLKGIFAKIVVPTNKFKALGEQAEKIRTKYNELRESISKALESGELTSSSKGFEKQQKELQALRNEYDRLIQKQKELALSGGAIQLNPTVKGTIDAFSNGVSRATNVVKRGFHAALKGANNALKSFAGHLKNAAKSAKDTVTGGVKATDMAKKFANELLRVSKMLKLMVTRMALRQVIAEVGNGFKSLAIHSDEFNNSVSSMMNASKQLGYSFSAMVAPLINALAPAIEYIISLLVKLLNVFNQVISALTGASTWNRAKKFTDSWRDSITGAGKAAGKAAKEIKKTVLGFDELNQLQDNKNSGGGSGSDIADMFETVKIDPKWKDFADWLKEMWKNKDFYDLGKLIGEKLRDTLESIPWDKIRKTSNDLGKALATLINGFVEVERLAYDIGYTVAQGVNTVFEFINGFVHNLHWDSIGKFIANMFNGFFETIDWALIKDTVVTGLKGLADAINSFTDTFHWDNISQFIINGVDTVVSGIRTFFETVKFKEIGTKLGEQLQKTIKGINWRDVGTAIGDILQAAIDFLSGFVSQLKVEDIRAALKEMVDGFFDTVDTEELGKLVADIIDLAVGVAFGFLEDNGKKFAEEGKKLLKSIWENLDPKTKDELGDLVGKIISAAVLAGIAKASVTIFASAIVSGFKTKIMSALFGTTGAGTGVTGGVVSGAGEVGAATAATFGAKFAAGLSAAFLPVAAIVAVAYPLAQKFSEILEPIIAENQKAVDALKGSAETTIPTYEEMSRAAREASHNQKEYAEKMQEMYDAVLQAHPELNELAKALEDNGIKGGKNVDTLVQINDGLRIFRENGGSAADTLTQLEDMYGKVDKKTQDFFNSLGVGEEKTTNVSTAMYDFNQKLKESESNENNLIKIYKNHNEVVEDMKRQHENVVGQFKTHWDVINQNKDATDKLTTAVKETTKEMPNLDKALQDSQKAMEDTSGAAEKTGEEIVNGIKEPIINAKFDEESKGLFDTVVDNIKRAFGIASPAKNMMPLGNDILLGINEGFEEKFGDFDSMFQDFYDNHVKTWFDKDKWSFSGVGEGLRDTFEKAKDAVKGVWNGIADKLNGEHEIGSSKIKINLPKFAGGGFPEDGLFMANHNELVGTFNNGKTAVANNEQIVKGIENGVYNAVMSAMSNNNSGSSYISNEIIVDGEVIARSVTKAQEKINRRYSPQTT